MKKEQNLLYTYEDGTTEKVGLDIKWYQNGNLCIRLQIKTIYVLALFEDSPMSST